MRKKTLVLGLGNILLKDEGIGVRAIEAIKERFILPKGVECLDGGVAGLNLLPVIAGFDRLIIIDAVAKGSPPGTIERIRWREVKQVARLGATTHQIGAAELLSIAEFQGGAPRSIVIIGIAPLDVSYGEEPTELIKASLPGLIDAVKAELTGFGHILKERSRHARGASHKDVSRGD